MGEQPLYVVRAHPIVHLGAYLGLAGLAVLGLIGLSVSVAVGLVLVATCILGVTMLEVVRRADRLAFYEHGVAREYRLFSTKRTFAEYDAVQDVDMNQGLLERLAGVGTLHINTSGGHGKEIIFRGVDRCHEVEAILREKMRPARIDTPSGENVR